MRIAVLENIKENAPRCEPLQVDSWAELSTVDEIRPIVDALRRGGHEAEFFEGNLALLETLPRFRPDLCFNMCEGHFGESRESQIPALLEMMRLPYTGAGVLALALTLDKPMTKRWLSCHGLPTPPYQVLATADAALDPALRFPLFVKPVREGSGKGVSEDSIVHDERQLRERVAWLVAAYRQPALVEPFIRGREITVGLLGNADDRASGLVALPAFEIVFRDPARGVYTHLIKSETPDGWVAGRNYHCPAPLDDDLRRELERLAKTAFRLTGCRDYARVDFRLDADANWQPSILEVNALPGIFRDWSDMSFEAAAAGMSHDDLILGIVGHAARRWGLQDGAAVRTRGADMLKIAVHGDDGAMQVQATAAIAAGERIVRLAGQELATPTRTSVQIGIGRHIDSWGTDPSVPGNVFRYLNHSCAANARMRGLDLIAVRPIAAGEQVTFDYDSNEWDMISPFPCACGAAHCRGLIRGYRHLDATARKRLEPVISAHLREMLATEELGASGT
jgi:D-alanine-D-alanine ligase